MEFVTALNSYTGTFVDSPVPFASSIQQALNSLPESFVGTLDTLTDAQAVLTDAQAVVNAIAAFNGITDLAAAPLSELQATKNSLETAKNIVDDLQLASTTEIASENVTDVDDEIEIKLAIIDAQIDVVDTQETFNNQKQNFLNGVTFQDVGGSSVSLLTDPGIIQGAVDNLFNKALEVAQAQVILNELKNEILNNYPTITQTMVDNLYEAAKQVVSAETVLGGLALEDYWEMIPGRFP